MHDVLADGGDWIEVRGRKKHIKGYLKEFLFDPGAGRRADRLAVGRRALAAAAGARIRAAMPTCWCSTSRPTTSTSRRSTCCRK